MRLIVFGANGPTGRRLVEQALPAGHEVTAVTRNPAEIRARPGLRVVRGDVRDATAVDSAIAGGDAVLSGLGVSYSRQPIDVYSVGTANMIAAMRRHKVDRLMVVSSVALDPCYRPSTSFSYTRVIEPFFMRRPGRTLYEDISRMEASVRASDLNWTIVRACWLFDTDLVSAYQFNEVTPRSMFTARSDLAAGMLTAMCDDLFGRKVVAVSTTNGTPSMMQQVWREGITKRKVR
jgi:uncharacterized protein YbjT (DUF2867 family)